MEDTLPDGPLVTPQWLKEHLHEPWLMVADCRYDLFDHELGSRSYGMAHIPGAFFLNMEKDLISEVQEHGGRHPLPNPADFTETMNRIGFTPAKVVIAYDNDGSGAARLWWMLNYYGHSKVRILNGGYPLWEEMGYEVTKEIPVGGNGDFHIAENRMILARMEDVRNARDTGDIVDSRIWDRYIGKFEPIDFKAGHIPGAINIPYTEAIEEKALFKNEDELKEIFSRSSSTPIVYCGSGVTSCVSFVAMRIIGLDPRLYAGSFSDWISYSHNEVITGPDP